jgi:hypothetical protein
MTPTDFKWWTLARLKALAAFLGLLATYAISQDWGFEFPQWATALAGVLTWLGVYMTPNLQPGVDDQDEHDDL